MKHFKSSAGENVVSVAEALQVKEPTENNEDLSPGELRDRTMRDKLSLLLLRGGKEWED